MKTTSPRSSTFRTRMRRADRLHETGKFSSEARHITHLLKDFGPVNRLLARRGLAYFQTGRFSAALRDFDRAVESNRYAKHTLYMRARAKEELDDPRGALEDYQRVISLDPEDHFAARNIALLRKFLMSDQMPRRSIDQQEQANSELRRAVGW